MSRRPLRPVVTVLAAGILGLLVFEWVFVADSQARSTDSKYAVLRSVTVGDYPAGVLLDRGNGLVYVANEFSDTISVVDATTLHVVRTIYTGQPARALALDAENGRLFVANDFSSTITVINTTSNRIIATIHASGYTNGVGAEFDRQTGQLYVLENTAAVLLTINPKTYAISGVVPIDPNPGGGEGFAIDHFTHTIYFPARGLDSVALIGERNGTTYAHIPMPGPYGPTTTFLDRSNGFIYVMLGWLLDDPGNQIVVLNPIDRAIVSTLTVGQLPDAYALDPSRHLLYVSRTASGEVSVISTRSNQVVATIKLGSVLPGRVAVDPVTGHVFVGEDGTDKLVELGLKTHRTTPEWSVNGPVEGSSPLRARWAA